MEGSQERPKEKTRAKVHLRAEGELRDRNVGGEGILEEGLAPRHGRAAPGAACEEWENKTSSSAHLRFRLGPRELRAHRKREQLAEEHENLNRRKGHLAEEGGAVGDVWLVDLLMVCCHKCHRGAEGRRGGGVEGNGASTGGTQAWGREEGDRRKRGAGTKASA